MTMSHTIADTSTDQAEAFNKQELSEINKAAALLSGDWIVDPFIDNRHAKQPLVWVHPVPLSNDATFSLGVMKQDGLMLITGRYHDQSEHGEQGQTSCHKLGAALTMLSNAMLMLRDGNSESLKPQW
jgi:hypothetical protein